MADGGKDGPLVLNKEWIKGFINGDLHEFQTAIGKILSDAPSERFASDMHGADVQSIVNLGHIRPSNIHTGNSIPLAIGALAGDDGLAGDLVKAVKDTADQLAEFVKDQKTLFEDIESNLRDAMETLLKTEGDSLNKIDGEKFLDVFEDVNDDITDSLGGSGGGGGGGDDA
ncbi:type VII secretion system-associated protein [Streptomyces sp. NBC_00370]|uniref:type VII secretion system-associated protein n=1 Tax=Streptomyces sp. NBC_00370 TaxID=2975728 RepID=UPI002E26AD35